MEKSPVIPTINVGGIDMTRVVLGCDPFIAYVSLYPSPKQKLRTYKKRFSEPSKVAEVINVARQEGVGAMWLPKSRILEEAIELVRDGGSDISLIPTLYQFPLELRGTPVPLDRLQLTMIRERLSVLKRESIYKEYMATDGFKCTLESEPLKDKEVRSLRVDKNRLKDFMKWIETEKCLRLVTTCVEFFALSGRLDLLKEIMEIFEKEGISICPISHVAKAFDALEKEGIKFPAYCAPVNKIGFMMFPSRDELLRSVLSMGKPVLAIKPLGGGRLNPREAFDYLFKLSPNITCQVGVASTKEARETFSTARTLLV